MEQTCASTFQAIEAYGISVGVNLAFGKQGSERVQAAHVTPGYFKMLETEPQIGRGFYDDDSASVALISDRLWRGFFHADPQVIGREVTIDGKPARIAGVMPRGLIDPGAPDAGLWLADPVNSKSTRLGRHMSFIGGVIGRLKPSVTPEQGAAELKAIARGMDAAYPAPWSRYHSEASVRLIPLQQQLAASSKAAIFVLAGAVGFVLLIVCANLASMFLARATARQREMSTRAALGASRWQLLRMLLIESALVGSVGGMLGLVLARLSLSTLEFLLPPQLTQNISLDLRVLAFTFGCALAAGILFGLAPAFAATRVDLICSLKRGGMTVSERGGVLSLRSALAALQIACSLLLLAGAGLLLRSFYALLAVDPGFNSYHVLLAEVSLAPAEAYRADQQAEFYRRVLARVRRLPGVEQAAVTGESPLSAFQQIADGLAAEGNSPSDALVVPTSASAGYFKTLRIPLLAGRDFDGRDQARAEPVAILNQALAHILFPKRNPIGEHVHYGQGKGVSVRVVGVAGNIRHRSLDGRIWPEIFFPFEQVPAAWMSLVVRTTGDPLALAPAIRRSVAAIDRTQPVFNIESLDERLASSVATRRERAWLLGTFALMALLVAMVGVYGVMMYSAMRRLREMGIRIALGASRAQIFSLMFTRGMKVVATGVFVGLLAAAALTRVIGSFLFGIKPTDAVTFLAVSALVVAASSLAIYLPARRAVRVAPMTVLRED